MKDSAPIRSAAVLGAGTMGAQIAAHLANAGISVLLLDLSETVAQEGVKRVRGLKPDPFFASDRASLISLGGFDNDLPRVATVDWILEAVVEDLEVKRALLERVDRVRRTGTIVSSNTSGIPIAALADGRSQDFREHWLGTHFFNPPRYLHLVEVVPTGETLPDVTARIAGFAGDRLGKGVVVAKDSPNFIGNHIAILGSMRMIAALESGAFTVEELDAITGPALGRPKSATFRTMDLAGLDVLAHVARNIGLDPPPLIRSLIERGWVGEKAGQGFYKRVKGRDGASEILSLDPQSLTYRPHQSPRLPSLEAAKAIEDPAARIATLFSGKDRVGDLLRTTMGPALFETARITPDIAYSIDDVDRVMKWGFAWELGPFETIDAIGVRELAGAVDMEPPPLLSGLLGNGRNRFRTSPLPPAAGDLLILTSAKQRNRVLKRNPGASLVDLGDGVLGVEFHSKMNAIGADTVEMLQAGLNEAARNFTALVVGNEAPHFSAGANLMLLLLEAQEGNWDEIDLMVRAFQNTTQALRSSDVPVIVATGGLTLGGGCEIALHADRVQAAAETYIGLVEVGVGLIPGGGGTKEMVARMTDRLPHRQVDLMPFAQDVFETIGFARVSTSALDARHLGYIAETGRITMNRERLIADAKAYALERVREGYRKPPPRPGIVVGGNSVLATLKLGVHIAWRAGRISDHDAVVARALANVIAGGPLPYQATVSEQYLLDLEREAFLKLCGEPKTQERIAHTLKTGKALRN